jgi:RimJ/RimL family protein N-acetyltransferase
VAVVRTMEADEGSVWQGLYASVAEEGRWIGAEAPVDDRGAELGMGIVDGHRGQGIGTLMMEAAADWAAANGVERLHLDVFPHNEAAIGLYEKLGFVEIARHAAAWPRRIGERWDLLTMELRLA